MTSRIQVVRSLRCRGIGKALLPGVGMRLEFRYGIKTVPVSDMGTRHGILLRGAVTLDHYGRYKQIRCRRRFLMVLHRRACLLHFHTHTGRLHFTRSCGRVGPVIKGIYCLAVFSWDRERVVRFAAFFGNDNRLRIEFRGSFKGSSGLQLGELLITFVFAGKDSVKVGN